MNVILVNPPIRLPFAFAHYPMFSTLGLLHNAAYLRELGHTVRVVDAFTVAPRLNIRPDGDSVRHVGAEVPDLLRAIQAAAIELRGPTAFVVSVTMFSEMNRLQENLVPQTADAIRRAFPDAPVGLADFHICGMNYFPYDAEKVLTELLSVDWIVVGEGEPTLPGVLAQLEAGEPITGRPRLAWREPDPESGEQQNRFDDTQPPSIKALDELPPPAFDLLNMDNYFSTQADAIQSELVHEYHVVERQIPLMTSRGCPYRCSFCTNQALDLPWRSHTVPHLAELITTLRDRYEVDRFLFLDDNINVKKKRFRELVEWLAEAQIPWDAVNGYRADALDRETVRAIRAAGNTKVTVSAESGDPKLLDGVIQKKLKLSSVIDIARICEEERIPLQVHYIMGVPGETKTQINKTLEFSTRLFELHGAWPLLQHAIPFPGTALFRECEEKGYFIQSPFEIPGEVLEVDSIIRTSEFEPGEVIRMKLNAQHLHASTQKLVYLDVVGDGEELPSLDALRAHLDRARFLGGREVYVGGHAGSVRAGGEPTLRKDLPAILALVHEMDFERVTLVASAHGLANAARAKRVLTRRGPEGPLPTVDRLVIELCGPGAALHDGVVGKRGAFTRTLKGIAEAVKLGITNLEATIPVLRANLAKLPETVQFARKLGFRTIHLRYPEPDDPAYAVGQIPRWEDARDPMLKACVVGRRLKTEISIQAAPLCLLPEYPGVLTPLPPWALQRSRSLKVKHPACRECTEYILCGGFFRPEHEPVYGMLAALGLGDGGDTPQAPEADDNPGHDAAPEEA